MVAITEERSLSSTTPEIFYPSSDGEPLAETQQHASAILNTFGLLRLLQNMFLKTSAHLLYKSNQFVDVLC
jgi:hypothetical protein